MAKEFKGRFEKPTTRGYDCNKRNGNQTMYKNGQLESTGYGWSTRILVEKIDITA